MISTRENNSFFFSNKWWKTSQTVLSVSLLLLTIFIPLTTSAAINEQINYQGKLTDSAGDAVADASYSIVFRLYTVSSGGTHIWTETQSVTTTSGLFSVMLGSSTSLSDINFNQTLYLGVNVAADGEMSPRKIIGAVPAAFYANDSDTLDGLTASDFLYATTTNATGTISTLNTNTLNVFNSTTTNATTTNLFVSGNTRLGSLTGVLKATAGVVSASLVSLTSDISGILGLANGGTGTSTAPTYGQVLLGNASGTYDLVATSSLGISGGAGHDAVTLAGSLDYITLSGQVITRNAIDLATDITGLLAIANGGTGTSTQVTNGLNYYDGTRITSGTSLVFNGTNFGIGTSTPGSILSVNGVANFTSATSTFYSSGGINLAGGCFSIGGTCLSAGSGGVGSGTTGQFPYYAANGTTLTATSTIFLDASGRVGIGSTTPSQLFSVGNGFAVNSSGFATSTSGFAVTNGAEYISMTHDGDQGEISTGDEGDLLIFDGNNSGENYAVRIFGYNTADATSTHGAISLDDSNDEFLFDASDGNSGTTLGFGFLLDNSVGTSRFNIRNSSGVSLFTYDSLGHASTTGSMVSSYFIASSTTATSTLTKLAISSFLNVSSSATSTFTNGINVAGGCFSVNGACIGGGSSVNLSGATGILAIANGGTATSTQVTNGVNYFDGTRITSGASLVYNGTNFGIGTSTPGSLLSIGGVANFKSATSTFYSTGGINLSSGCFAIGSTCIGGGATNPAGSNGQIQFNNAGAFGAASDFTWDSTRKVLSVASTTSYSNLLVRYINSDPGSVFGTSFSADTYISVGKDDDTASTIGKNTYISIGGNGGSNPVGNTDGDGAVGGVVYLAGGGDGNSDSDGYGVGGAGGTVNMVYGGFGSTNEPSVGANGTVNVGASASSGGTMNIYVDTLFKDTFADVGSTNMCWDGTGGSNIGNCTSLRQYKTNIDNLALGLDAVMALTPRKFDWINGMGPVNDLGFIAEEVEAVSPQLASYDGTRLNGVKYDKMSALLVKAIQEQQQQISTLQTDLSNQLSTSIIEGDINGLWLLDDNQNIRPLAMLDLNNQSIINIKSLESSSGKWSLDEEGLFKVVGIEAEKLTVKNGVTTEDKTTGEFYCIYVDEGELITAQGRCEDLFEEELPELPDDTATTTASTTPPVDEIPQGGGGGDEPTPEEETPIEEPPVVEPTEDPVVTPDPLPPTPEPEAPPEPVEEEPEPEPIPEPAPQEPSAPDASSEPAI